MRKNPKITVLMPVYNCEIYLKDSIESILGQSFKDFEFLIINDGSTDNSGSIINNFSKQDDRIRVFHQENQGLAATLNFGISIAKGEMIARMDADDVSLSKRLAIQYNYMIKHSNIAVLGGQVQKIDEQNNFLPLMCYPIGMKTIANAIEIDSPFAHPSVIFRKKIISSVSGYRKAFPFAQDYDLWLRLYDKGYRLENLSDVILKYRVNSNGITSMHGSSQVFASVIAQISHKMRQYGIKDIVDEYSNILEENLESFFTKYLSQKDCKKIGTNFNFEKIKIDLKKINSKKNVIIDEVNRVKKIIKKTTCLNREQKYFLFSKIFSISCKNSLFDEIIKSGYWSIIYSFGLFLYSSINKLIQRGFILMKYKVR